MLTIVPPAEPVSLAYGWPYLNSMVGVVGEPVHRAGERIFNLGRWFQQHDMAYFASRDLVLELVRQNVTGFGYRPVKVQQQ